MSRLVGFHAEVTDLKGEVLAVLQDIKETEVIIPLNETRTAKLTLSIYNPVLMKHGMSLVAPMSRLIRIRYNGYLVFWGRILLPTWKGEEAKVELSCIDSSVMYKKHYHTYGCQAVDVGYFVDGTGMFCLAESVEPLQTQKSPRLGAGVYFGIDHTTHQIHVKPIGDLEPDADQGSFRKVARGDQIWESMVNLSQIEGPPVHEGGIPVLGPDFELQPVDEETEQTTYNRTAKTYGTRAWTPYFHAQLNVYDKQGEDKSGTIIWHYGWGRNNLRDCEYAPNGDEIKNYAVAVNPGGPSSSSDFTSRAGAHNPKSWEEYGILGAWITAGQVDPLSILQAAADATVEAYAWPLEAIVIYPKREGELSGNVLYTYMKDYKVGDIIKASLRKGALNFAGSARVIQVTLKQVENGTSEEAIEEVLVTPELGEGEVEKGDDLSGLDGG
jgi:hypothetical protein